MRLLLLTFSMLLVTSKSVHSQTPYKHSVFAEAGGNAYWYSINYERQFTKGITTRIGIGYYDQILAIPVMFGKVFGQKNHHLELSGGFDLVNNANTDDLNPTTRQLIALTAFIGYRYQNSGKPFFAKAGFTPIWTFYNSQSDFSNPERVFPWAGVSAGYRF